MEIDENLNTDVSVNDKDEDVGEKKNKSDLCKYPLQLKLFVSLAEQFSDVLEAGGIRAVPYMQVKYMYSSIVFA